MTKTALILGVGGQDGSYLADLLLEAGYNVHGLYRHNSGDSLHRIQHVVNRITLHKGDITDPPSVAKILRLVQPDEIYNEADQDNIGWSYDTPGQTFDVTAKAVATTLETIRLEVPKAKFFQPVSSTIFGFSPHPQNESSPLDPRSPYAIAKVSAYHTARFYRDHYGMFVCVGIMFNHDSPRRGRDYLLQEICRSAISVKQGKTDTILVGDPGQIVDIGFAGDYMKAAHAMMQQPKPDDYVIGTGHGHAISWWVAAALDLLRTSAVIACEHNKLTAIQPTLVADYHKARSRLGWYPDRLPSGLLSDILVSMGELL